MIIRYLEDSDKQGVCRLSHQINLEHHQNEPDVFCAPVQEGDDWDFWKQSHDKDGGFILVAVIGDNIVGFVAAEISETLNLPFLRPQRKCRIATIVVCENHQREGVGSALFDEVSQIAKSHGASKIVLEVFAFNRTAIEFYEGKGFTAPAMHMSKTLTE